VMDFGLSEHRREIQRWAAELPDRLGGTGYVRGLREDPGVARAGYAALAAAGVLELGLAQDDAFDRALVHEQLGTGLIVSPALDGAVFAAAFLGALPEARAAKLLGQVTDGSVVVALAPQLLLALAGGSAAGAGQVVRTPWAGLATHVLVPRRPAGVSLVPVTECTAADRGFYLNTLPVSELLLPADGAGEVFDGPETGPALEQATAALLGVVAAFSLGGARRAVSLATEYARQRHQFGRPIGSFQAQQHKLATAELRVRQAQHLVYAAADSPAGPQASFYPAAACDLALRAFSQAAQTASLVHGGYGLTLEFDIHLYFVYAKLLETLYGPVALRSLRSELIRETHA
jgi:alkylation response protein AidB-like acyl-CoA dehydrogenase